MKRTFKEKTWAGLLTCALLLQAAPISALTTDDTSQQDRSPITADSLSDPSEAEGSEEADLDSPEMQSKEEHPTKSDDDQQQTKTELPESNDNALPASLVNWDHKIFGESTDTKNNGVQVNPDGSVTVKSVNGKGKFQSSGSDGLTYYYTQVPKSSNFKLAAKISVDSWKYSNGQEGFALMVRDAAPYDSKNVAAYSNSFSFLGSRIAYQWDRELQQVSSAGDPYTMRLGVGTRTITGIQTAGVPAAGTVNVSTTPFNTDAVAFEAGKNYNLIGNLENPTDAINMLKDQPTTFDVVMEKTNTGFEVSYTDFRGQTWKEILYDWDTMFQQDPNNAYVGFAAGRNMTITVKDIDMTYSDPATDPPAVPRPKEKIKPDYQITSRNHTGEEAYEFTFKGNADGWLSLYRNDQNGELLADKSPVKANEEARQTISLLAGENTIHTVFQPDPAYLPGEHQIMENYDPFVADQQVFYQAEQLDTLYVTQAGSETGIGTKADPLSIYRAVRYARPGQTILLAGGTYQLKQALQIPAGADGTATEPIRFQSADKADPAILDFSGESAGIKHAGDFWEFRNFHITNTGNLLHGFQVNGSNNLLEEIQTYRNGNTGIQISGFASDPATLWPANNLIKNCTSFENADSGFEDADGFAAKLTVGEGNVFDGCIAYHNADDGWDLFAKNETGRIGTVTIKNSVAYNNGFMPDPNETRTGNGNGFKMGGSSLPGGHQLINSLAFGNLAKGIDSNSAPDIKIQSSTSLNNASYNVALYTQGGSHTDFAADGILSFRTLHLEQSENLKLLGEQDPDAIYTTRNYWWDETRQQSLNTLEAAIDQQWFATTDSQHAVISRYENGSINVNGLMQLTAESADKLAEGIGARFTEETSPSSEYPLAEIQEPNQTLPSLADIDFAYTLTDKDGKETQDLMVGNKMNFSVKAFQPNQGIVISGDRKFIPTGWQMAESDSKGQLTPAAARIEGRYEGHLTLPEKAGDYLLIISMTVQEFDGTNFVTLDSAPAEVQVPLSIEKVPSKQDPGEDADKTPATPDKNSNQPKLPSTGEQAAPLLTVIGGMICLMILAGIFKKRKADH